MAKRNDIAVRLLGVVVALLGTGWLALQTPQVQTGIAEKLLEKATKDIHGSVTFGQVSIEPVNSFTVKDLVILDDNPYNRADGLDTLFRAKSVSGKLSLKSILSKKGVHFSRLRVDDSMLAIAIEPSDLRSNGMITNLERIFGLPEPPKGQKPSPDIFQADDVEINGFRYRMINYTLPFEAKPGCIDWDDLDLTASTKVHSLKYTGGRMSGIVDMLTIHEKCGYTVESLTGRARVGMGKATIDHIHFKDAWSDASIPLYSMAWEDVKEDFKYFTEQVRLELKADGGNLDLRTINAFGSAGLPSLDLALQGGRFTGYINDFSLDHLKLQERSSGVATDLSGTLTGASGDAGLLLNTKINNLTFTTRGLQQFLKKVGVKADIKDIAPGRVFSFSGRAKGPLNRLQTSGSLGSRIGRASFKAAVKGLANKKGPIQVQGTVNTRNLNIGEFIGNPQIGECTAEAGFRLSSKGKNLSASVDSLLVDRLSLFGYSYTGMKAVADYDGHLWNGRVICGDPALNAALEGSGDVAAKSLNLGGSIGYADLQAMGIDRRGKSLVSAGLTATVADGHADFSVRDLCVENDMGRKELGNITVKASDGSGSHAINLHSDFADASYQGEKDIKSLLSDLLEITLKRELPSLFKDASKAKSGGAWGRARVNMHDTRDLLSYVMPGLYIADSTSLKVDVGRDGLLDASLISSRLAWKTDYLKGLEFTFDNRDGSLNALVLSDETSIAGIGFSNAALTGYARGDSFFAGFSYDGIRGLDNVGEIYLDGEISREAGDTLQITARPLSSFIRFDGEQWDLDQSTITLRSGMASIEGFRLHNGNQSICLDGGISQSRADTLRLKLNDVDMSVINYFLKDNYDIHGRTGGRAMLTSPLSDGIKAIASLDCDSLQIGGVNAGMLRAGAYWNDADDKLNVVLRNNLDGSEVLSATGTYHPKARRVELGADLDGINLVIAKPFVSGFLSDISGGMRGTITASGPLDSLTLASRGAAIDHARVGIEATGVTYGINGPFHIDNNGLHFDDITVTDGVSGTGTVFGSIRLRNLSKIVMDMGMRLRRLEVLNVAGSEGVRGKLFADGQVYVSGPTEAIVLDADLATAGTGNLHVPLTSAISASRSDLLTFTSHEPVYNDPYDDVLAQYLEQRRKAMEEENSGSDFIAHLRVRANPGLQAAIELDNTGDNLLKFSGDGTINVNFRPSKDLLEITGDYSISDGSYRFAVPGIVSKDFSINNGSSISFTGDIMESILDIGATYTLRTSLNRLLADTTSVSTRRPVNCGIHISDRLAAPSVSFSIDVPDLDPSTKSEVEGALNTEDKVQKQFIALLVTGSFIPNEQSGVVNNPNILYSNVSEIMSRQLSNILSRLEIPLDMGLGYQQNSAGTDLFDVAVSTELFNNRVEVNGSVGNRQSTTGTTTYGDVVGDLDIDVKLDKQGQVRLNLFSHSADEYTAYLDNTQRNGGGITLQKEFNTWGDLFRSIFKKKKKKADE